MSKYRYAGRTAIITGGGGDIGSCLAGLLVERSMNVVIADRNEHAAHYVARDLGDRALPFAGDLADEAEMVRLLEVTEARFGGLDLLINGIATTTSERFHSRSLESIRSEIDITLTAPCIMTRLAVPYLQKSDDPRVITTTSLGGIQPLRETPIYTAAKFGLRGAMLSFALDEELHGIKVGTVAPTATDTQMLRQEALDDGNVLNFIDTPQTALDVARTFLRVLEKPQLEAYPKTSDSILTRLAMLFPNLQPRVLPFFERKGRRGMRRYIEDLRKRGLVQEQNGKLVLTPRPERDG
ncbi:SDR family NAD(P)-dependent oxidoreductase [Pseudophaeobacter arcticus]|jgi:NAD(P)-dependent dehydrogenase (short-subunit alcohol dehydrogenase family)|uniref:SDR family NAD(P)-dependent oxidoreductase n=1 Tax=Pseudophaeobacter arcticus TaxID=385492 RepID=UPI0039E5E1A6